MSKYRRVARLPMPSLPFLLLLVLLACLWIAGGASRPDAIGQVVVRGTAAALLIIALLFAQRPNLTGSVPVALLLIAVAALPMAQMIPLPPDLWQALPARAMFSEAVSGEQPWRPWSIAPDATRNAAASLLVPAAILLFAIGVRRPERARLPATMLALIFASMMLGLLDVSRAAPSKLLITEGDQVGGPFANNNHFALLLALGCLIAPVWAFLTDRTQWGRNAIAASLVILFLLLILATGSRAGIVLGAVALALIPLMLRERLRQELRRAPGWVGPSLAIGALVTIAAFVALSITLNRAESITRVMTLEAGEDMRVRALPVVRSMIATYFPAGTGFGSFDPIFRIHEPFALLKPTYFNHAHNDFLEIVLDGGLPALLLLLLALGWWAVASFRVWRLPAWPEVMVGRLGSAVLLLILLASAVDYPSRTPLIMAVIVLAALWLSWGASCRRDALREHEQHL